MDNKPEERKGVILHAAPRGGSARLFPEQAASFDLALQNHGAAPEEVTTLDGNMDTPLVRAFDAGGNRLFELGGSAMGERIAGNMGPLPPMPPRKASLEPGKEQTLWVNLWAYHEPLKLGAYGFEAIHHARATGPVVVSNRVPFEIVRADVLGAALGYDSSVRMASTLAWIAAPHDKQGPPRLLARLSGFDNHASVQQGGTDLGEAAPDARPAVSQIPPDGKANWLGWIAITGPKSVELVRHNMTQQMWRSAPVALPITDAVAVPRFADRGHAVFLATGKGASGPTLAGAVVTMGAPPSPAWAVPLSAQPSKAVCAFGMSGPISVLYATDDGQSTRFIRIDLDESGRVVAPEQVVRTTPNRLVALAVDMRVRAPLGFVILESNRTMPDRLALVRIPLAGAAPPIVPFAPLGGWPSVDDGGLTRVIPAQAIDMEVGIDGVPRVGLTDERGRLFGGPLDGSPLSRLSGEGSKALFPHVVVTSTRVTTSCFTEEGFLFHAGGR